MNYEAIAPVTGLRGESVYLLTAVVGLKGPQAGEVVLVMPVLVPCACGVKLQPGQHGMMPALELCPVMMLLLRSEAVKLWSETAKIVTVVVCLVVTTILLLRAWAGKLWSVTAEMKTVLMLWSVTMKMKTELVLCGVKTKISAVMLCD